MFARSFCGRAGSSLSWSSRRRMPLRAKVHIPAFAADAPPENSIGKEFKELPEDDPDDVLFNTLYGLRTIELNRPKKLHSLNGSMIRKIYPRLREWVISDMANIIVIKGSGPKAFCAGGDVAALANWNNEGSEGQQRSTDYFGLEYKLDHYIATLKKPMVAFIDGITMGGGVGLSVHLPFRIATERTVFAMPETTIGFFPDVGASFFLPRMNGAVGTYLALTSDRLKGVNAFYAGIATHYLHSSSLPALESRLAELRFKDYDDMTTRLKLIDSTIEEFCSGLPHDEPILLAGDLRKAIDRCFGCNNVPDILSALKAETGSTKEWAEKTLKTIYERSPTSVYVTLRQMRLGQKWSIRETFQREHQIAAKFMDHPDFTTGVTALLIKKPPVKPEWQPASLDNITSEQNIADPFFNVDAGYPITMISSDDYRKYPHAEFSLPTEAAVAKFVRNAGKSQKDVVNHFVEERRGKQGVREVVGEIVSRKTTAVDGKAVWVDEDGQVDSL